MQRWLGQCLQALLLCWVGVGIGNGAIAAPPRYTCPTEFEPLVSLMLRDLPSYSNRISQRLSRRDRVINLTSSMLLTSPPDFQPLPLGPGGTQSSSNPETSGLRQVFFTTLERQYTAGKPVQLQRYHWVFLTQTVSGWRLALLYSRTGPYKPNEPISPPEDSSQGGTAQAIRTWLRDCHIGRIRPS